MPKPLALCIEDLKAPSDVTRYIRCVALGGRQPGLRLDAAGDVQWQHETGVACELWVSADERLVLYRPEGAAPVTLHRGERSLEVPPGKPVFVIDQDQIVIGPRQLCLHVHGEAPAVTAPAPLPVTRPNPLSRLGQVATTAAMVGAAIASAGCIGPTTPTIDVRDFPPTAPPPSSTPTIDIRDMPPEVAAPTPTATLSPTIEIRETPPIVAPLEATNTLTPTVTSTLVPPSPTNTLAAADINTPVTPTIEVRDFPPTATPIPPDIIEPTQVPPTPTIEVRDFPPTAPPPLP